MKKRSAASVVVCAVCFLPAMAAVPMQRPHSGKVEIFPESQLKPGMMATAWTVFQGTQPEPVPVEIMGVIRNLWGPKQDVILGKMGGKALRTNVAAGMSGSPVYIDGKLVGAISLQMSFFSPDAICGITPISLMLEIKDFDKTTPVGARIPTRVPERTAAQVPSSMLQKVLHADASEAGAQRALEMVPIATPITFSGFTTDTIDAFGPLFQQLGMTVAQGGAGGNLRSSKPGPGWQTALQPGDPITAVLVDGDMDMTALGTVTYNDGKRVLAFGHPFFNLGPVDMPIAKGDILMTLGSSYQPHKIGNATEIVGALRQDRHSGILGVLGATADMVPVSLTVRSYSNVGLLRENHLHFNVFINDKWTPYLMMVTLFNSIQGLNDYADEATYRLSGKIELDGQPNMSLTTMLAPSEMPVPAPMALAGWWGDKFNRLFMNSVEMPRLKRVDATIDLLPDRRIATIENAWIPNSEVEAGATVPVKVFLRPYRGERIERDFTIKLPAGLSKGDHRILFSDAETLNRMQNAAGAMNRFMDIPQTISLINQERSNNKLYVSLIDHRPTVYSDDKTMPSLPASVMNVMETGRTASRSMVSSAESAVEQMSIPFDQVISGSYSLRITVK
jgi:hypothetical protein